MNLSRSPRWVGQAHNLRRAGSDPASAISGSLTRTEVAANAKAWLCRFGIQATPI
jgi:hypothetical protein